MPNMRLKYENVCTSDILSISISYHIPRQHRRLQNSYSSVAPPLFSLSTCHIFHQWSLVDKPHALTGQPPRLLRSHPRACWQVTASACSRLVALVNPGWKSASDFGLFGAGAAKKALSEFDTTYSLRSLVVYGYTVRAGIVAMYWECSRQLTCCTMTASKNCFVLIFVCFVLFFLGGGCRAEFVVQLY